MKNHSVFTRAVQDFLKQTYGSQPQVLEITNAIMRESRGGVAPEGLGSDQLNAIVDSIYKLSVSAIQPAAPQAPPIELTAHKFSFGTVSTERLQHVVATLRNCALAAIEISAVDFMVMQTIRTETEQAAAVKAGHSRTMHSKHLPGPDGLARAMDLGAWVGGKVVWTEDCYADIAFAMDRAATSLGLAKHIRWGAAWDRVLSDFGGTHDAYLTEARAYAQRHAGSDLIDMPHFEWVD
jgi:peptidoglycan L-alanyl-D-glutamate endopeptidase CwlK